MHPACFDKAATVLIRCGRHGHRPATINLGKRSFKVEWLEVCRWFRVAVIVVPEDPDLGLSEINADRYEQGNIDLQRQHFPVPLVNDTDWIDEEQPEIDAHIRSAIHPKTERIIGRRIQEFSTYVRRLTYSTRFGEGRAYVAEQPGAVLSSSIWKPLRDRLSSAVVVFLVTLFLGLLVHYLYTSRSGWFKENGMSVAVFVASCIAASFGAWFALEIGLPKHLVRKDNLGFSLMGVSCSWFAIAVCWFATGPSLANASKLIQENDFRRAKVEIQAYQRIHGREKASVGLKSELAEILAKNKQAEHERIDRQHLEEVEAALDIFGAVDKLGVFWHDRTLHRRAHSHVKILADENLRDAASNSDVGLLNKMQKHLRYVDSNLVERVRFYVKIIEVTVCVESQDYECAYRILEGTKDPPNDEMALERWNSQRKQLIHNLNEELQHTAFEPKDLDARKIQIERALRYSEIYQSLTGENAHRKINSLRAKHKQVISSIANREKRKEAVLIRKARSESRRGRARSHRKKTTKPRRSRSGNRVRCCDGSYSPSCTYSQGSLRRCCSHHKGVC